MLELHFGKIGLYMNDETEEQICRIKMPDEVKRRVELKKICIALHEVESRFASMQHRRPRYFFALFKESGKKYHRTLFRILNFLKDKRGDYKNDILFLSRDYFEVIFNFYNKINKMPFIGNLGPSLTNKMRFDDFLISSEMEDECYWRVKSSNYWVVKSRAKLAAFRCRQADIDLKIVIDRNKGVENQHDLKVIYPGEY